MQDVRKADPSFTKFVPRSAVEAVDRFVRCRKNGLKPMLVPECLIECAKGLSPQEMTKFEDWIVNPGPDLSKVKLVEVKAIRESNDAVFAENVERVEARITEVPPVPMQCDEKDPGPDDDVDMSDVMELEFMTLRAPSPDMGTPSTR